MSVRMSAVGGCLIVRQRDSAPDPRGQGRRERLADGRVGGVVDGDRHGRGAGPLSAAGDHPQLERQQLVEGEPAEGVVACLEGQRVVGRFEGRRDAGQAHLAADGGRQVLRVGGTRPIERVADGGAEAGSGQPGGEPVDRHDATGEQDLVVALEDLEVRVVEGQLPAEPLDTPGDHDLVVDLEASFDITPAEPGRLDRARLVGQGGDRPLDPAPERGQNHHVRDPDLRRDHRPGLHLAQVAEPGHLAQVVVAPRQEEQQVAHVVDADPHAGPPERGAGRQPGTGQWGIEQLDRVERRRRERGSRLGHAYSAEIRYR